MFTCLWAESFLLGHVAGQSTRVHCLEHIACSQRKEMALTRVLMLCYLAISVILWVDSVSKLSPILSVFISQITCIKRKPSCAEEPGQNGIPSDQGSKLGNEANEIVGQNAAEGPGIQETSTDIAGGREGQENDASNRMVHILSYLGQK